MSEPRHLDAAEAAATPAAARPDARVGRFTASDGTALVYDDLGPPSAPTIVLCHGLAAAAEQFSADAEFLAAAGYRVLVPDLRGHGRSASPAPIDAKTFAFSRLAADMVDLLDRAGADRVHWVGNSLGGLIGLELLPSRRLASLTSFGTAFAIRLPRLGAHHLLPPVRAVLGRNGLAALTAWRTTRDPAARRRVASILREARIDVVACLAGLLTHYDLTDRATAAEIPLLCLHCGRDPLVNAALAPALTLLRDHPQFRRIELPAAGHCANLDAPDEFRAALLGFFGAISRGPER